MYNKDSERSFLARMASLYYYPAMDLIIMGLIIGAAVVFAAIYIRKTAPAPAQDPSTSLKLLNDSMQALNGNITKMLSDSNRLVGDRMQATSDMLMSVRQELVKLDESSKKVIELGKDIAGLEDILKPPKLRGGLGEMFLEELLKQVIPADHYEIQHKFKDGLTVDAAIILKNGMVPVDAKFPLENFRKAAGAISEDERKAQLKLFARDVKAHIDAISSKYIRTDEGTFDFALMYIPAENIYYEVVIKPDESEAALQQYALKKHVIPVSPGTFYAYLQTIILGLRGMKVEEQSRTLIDSVMKVSRELGMFQESFRKLGQHIDASQKNFADASKRMDKISVRIEQVGGLEFDNDAAKPEAV